MLQYLLSLSFYVKKLGSIVCLAIQFETLTLNSTEWGEACYSLDLRLELSVFLYSSFQCIMVIFLDYWNCIQLCIFFKISGLNKICTLDTRWVCCFTFVFLCLFVLQIFSTFIHILHRKTLYPSYFVKNRYLEIKYSRLIWLDSAVMAIYWYCNTQKTWVPN